MKAMRYMINLKEGTIPEMSIYVENYHNKGVFIFVNQISGAFAVDAPTGKKRLELVDKTSTQVFDISADNYLVLDLLDALANVHTDVVSLMSRYFSSRPAKPAQASAPAPEEQEMIFEEKP